MFLVICTFIAKLWFGISVVPGCTHEGRHNTQVTWMSSIPLHAFWDHSFMYNTTAVFTWTATAVAMAPAWRCAIGLQEISSALSHRLCNVQHIGFGVCHRSYIRGVSSALRCTTGFVKLMTQRKAGVSQADVTTQSRCQPSRCHRKKPMWRSRARARARVKVEDRAQSRWQTADDKKTVDQVTQSRWHCTKLM